MRSMLLGVSILSFGTFTFSQSTVTAGGNDANGSGGSIAYSIGQIDYSNVSNANHNWNEGVQQPYELFDGVGLEELTIDVQLYPNPTSDHVQVFLGEFNGSKVNFRLYDLAGKLIREEVIESEQTQISLKELSAGEYMLHISIDNRTNTYKLIKH